MRVEELLAWLAAKEPNQREKLAILGARYVETIRALPDEAHRDVIRAIKKRLGSPKIADHVAALVRHLVSGRCAKPVIGSRDEPAPVAWVGTIPGDAQLATLEAAIAADPEARGPYSVLADHWSTLGDPRGELIMIGQALAKNPTHKAMRTAWTRLVDANVALVWGNLASPHVLTRDVDWYMGFIRSFTIPRDPRIDVSCVLRVLLDEPGPARFVQSITVRTAAPETAELVARVLARRPRPTLSKLALGSEHERLGDVSPMWPAIENVRELSLAGWGTVLGDVRAPKLERLALDPRGEDPLAPLASILAATGVPQLRALAWTSCADADHVLVELARSPLLPQLHEIDLRKGALGDAGAEVVLRHRERFAHVRRWRLDDNQLSAEMRRRLAELPGTFELGCQ